MVAGTDGVAPRVLVLEAVTEEDKEGVTEGEGLAAMVGGCVDE